MKYLLKETRDLYVYVFVFLCRQYRSFIDTSSLFFWNKCMREMCICKFFRPDSLTPVRAISPSKYCYYTCTYNVYSGLCDDARLEQCASWTQKFSHGEAIAKMNMKKKSSSSVSNLLLMRWPVDALSQLLIAVKVWVYTYMRAAAEGKWDIITESASIRFFPWKKVE